MFVLIGGNLLYNVVDFCHTTMQISHNCICLPSLLSLFPFPPSHPSRSSHPSSFRRGIKRSSYPQLSCHTSHPVHVSGVLVPSYSEVVNHCEPMSFLPLVWYWEHLKITVHLGKMIYCYIFKRVCQSYINLSYRGIQGLKKVY